MTIRPGPRLVCACLGFAALAALAQVGRAQAATTLCTQNPGGRVVLESDAVDPDVFLWDSRTRLVDYAAGQWGNTRAIFAHTVLAEPGTRATVVACVASAAHPKYSSGDEDAIGVKIMSGPYKGRYGWVPLERHSPEPDAGRPERGQPPLQELMATVETSGGELAAGIEGWDRVWALRGRLSVPLAHVSGASSGEAAGRECTAVGFSGTCTIRRRRSRSNSTTSTTGN